MNSQFLGHIQGLSAEEYRAAPGVSASNLKEIIKGTPKHYKWSINNLLEETQAMAFGTAFHAAVLEPETFKQDYAVKPDGMSFATKEGKLWREGNANKKILSYDDYHSILAMRESILGNETVRNIFNGGMAEQSFFTKCNETGLTKKCRADYVVGNYIIDFKSTSDSGSPFGFDRTCSNYAYHIQSAYYLDVIGEALGKEMRFVFCVVEKRAPHSVAMYELGPESLKVAREKISYGLNMIAKCERENYWPDWAEQNGILTIESHDFSN